MAGIITPCLSKDKNPPIIQISAYKDTIIWGEPLLLEWRLINIRNDTLKFDSRPLTMDDFPLLSITDGKGDTIAKEYNDTGEKPFWPQEYVGFFIPPQDTLFYIRPYFLARYKGPGFIHIKHACFLPPGIYEIRALFVANEWDDKKKLPAYSWGLPIPSNPIKIVIRKPYKKVDKKAFKELLKAKWLLIFPLDGCSEKDVKVLKTIKDKYPSSVYAPYVQYLYAYSLFATRKLKEAIAEFRRCIETYPDLPLSKRAEFDIAKCYYRMGEMEKAEKLYDTLRIKYPKSVHKLALERTRDWFKKRKEER